MKILVIGDTHGKLNRVRDVWPKLKDIDLIIHTGDYYTDAIDLEDEFGVPVAFVKGNCDGCYSSDRCSTQGGDYGIVETEFGRILLVHGHNEHVNYGLDKLRYKALENDCIAAVFGHTHSAMVLEEDIWYVNPGSLTQPRDGSGGSYGIIRTGEDRFDATVVYYETIMAGGGSGGAGVESHGASGGRGIGESTNKKSGKTGFISDLLKYSDRF